MDSKATQFLDDCWKIVRARGGEDSHQAMMAQVGWGLKADGALCYKDKVVSIVAEKAPSKRILIEKNENRNPVCCTDKDGNPFRWHGEFIHVNAHVRMLAIEIDEESSEVQDSSGSR